MSTEQDSVRRLAEIRLELSKYGELPSEEVDYLLSLIDSLTAERDNAVWRADRLDETGRTASLHAQAQAARAKAAEAEVKRLREALVDIVKDGVVAEGHWSDCCGDDDVMCSVHDILNQLAALATPPPEGGQSDG